MNPWNIFSCLVILLRFSGLRWLVDHKVKIENLSDKDILFGIIGYEDEIFVNHFITGKTISILL